MGITIAVSRIFDLIIFVLFITICLSWIPTINWQNEPFKALRSFSDFFLLPFRKLIPPIGMLDISPIVAFIFLSILRNIVIYFLASLGI